MLIFLNVLGYTLAVLSALIYAPQVFKVVKKNNTNGLSWQAFSVSLFGAGLWLIFTSSFHDVPAFVSNLIMFLLQIIIIFYVFRSKILALIIGLLFIVIILAASIIFLILPQINVPYVAIYAFTIVATLCTGLAFLPQSIKIWKTKKIENYSLIMSFFLWFANILWIVYWCCRASTKIEINDIVLVCLPLFSAFFTVLFQSIIFVVFLKNRKNIYSIN